MNNKQNHSIAWNALLISVITTIAGCPDPQAARKQQEAEARHRRELQMTQQTASATATTQTLLSQQSVVQAARQEGFQAGEASGRNAAMEDVNEQKEIARKLGHQTGMIEGELKGHQAGFKQGEATGYAKAAADEFRKGQEQGAIYGEIKGRSEAEKEAAQKIELAEEMGEARGLKIGKVEGFEAGKEQQRRESFWKIASVVVCVSCSFVAVLFFVLVHREPGSALVIQRQNTLLRLQEQEREERLLALLERAVIPRISQVDKQTDAPIETVEVAK
ncbi:hypothetical protein RISK_005271 [Rhodopirellula islandica]|uniref:Transmembrane protein n=1 Tax=Rhodopirellula islandica TaxID=595434 RepID=A0A0J1B5W4_RHOIS|nr:hypothetical protein [Rhodopirellula islandica]KLU02205.1 hypothetical protein RISK_005271 [Rhodopirellula islandica]